MSEVEHSRCVLLNNILFRGGRAGERNAKYCSILLSILRDVVLNTPISILRGSENHTLAHAYLYDLFGPPAERYIRERGRWASDVAQIYQRVSASAHGAMSRAIGDSEGIDLQSMLGGWSQLAVSHGRCRL